MNEEDSETHHTDLDQAGVMRRMLELAEEQTALSHERSELSKERSRMSADRSRMSEDRSRMSAERSEMSRDRSRMSADRSEMSAERSYMNTERTMSNWTRTALALMVFGIAVDRFGLLLRHLPGEPAKAHTLSTWGGAALVALGVLIVLAAGIRFLAYGLEYQRRHRPPKYHGPYLAATFALLVTLFGIALLIMMFVLSM